MKLTPLLPCPLTTAITFPVTDPGTVTPMLVELQLATVAAAPLKVTVLLPRALPKLLPVIVTAVPGDPDVMVRLLITGAGTVKLAPLLD